MGGLISLENGVIVLLANQTDKKIQTSPPKVDPPLAENTKQIQNSNDKNPKLCVIA